MKPILFIYQIKLKGIPEPQTILSKTEIFDLYGNEVEWWREIGRQYKKEKEDEQW